MDLVSLMYRYVNRPINADVVVEELKKIDLEKYSKDEQKEIQKLQEEIEEIVKTTPNEIDEIEKNRIAEIEKLLASIKKTLDANNSDEEAKKFLKERYEKLLQEKEITKDGGTLYKKVFQLLTQNDRISSYCQKMDDLELLEFIAQYIRVPNPPNISQNAFDDLVKAGIKKDKREALWRLAFNYYGKNKDFSLIVDYFIKKRDAYYLTELISAVDTDLNFDSIIEKVGKTKDLDFFNEIVKKGKYLKDFFTEKQINKINEIIKKRKDRKK